MVSFFWCHEQVISSLLCKKLPINLLILFFQDIRGRYPPQGIKQLLQWPPIQIQMFPEQKSIWILVISQLYLEALKLFNLYLVLCVWLVDHLQENMCKFFKLFTNAQIHKFVNSRVCNFTSSQIHELTNSKDLTNSQVPEFTISQAHENQMALLTVFDVFLALIDIVIELCQNMLKKLSLL